MVLLHVHVYTLSKEEDTAIYAVFERLPMLDYSAHVRTDKGRQLRTSYMCSVKGSRIITRCRILHKGYMSTFECLCGFIIVYTHDMYFHPSPTFVLPLINQTLC